MRSFRLTPPVISLLPLIALIPISTELIQGFNPDGVKTLFDFFLAATAPSTDPLILKSSWQGLQITIATAFISWLLSVFIGIFLGILSSNIFWETIIENKFIGICIRRILAIPRAIHEIIWGLLLLQILGLNPWVAILAITIPYSSLVSRVVANQLDELDYAPLIAVRQSGAESLSTFLTALSPPMIPVLVIYCGYRLECAIRDATILGIFGLGGLGTEIQLTLQSLQFRELWTSLWMLLIVMILLENTLNKIQNSNISLKKLTTNPRITLLLFLLFIATNLIWLQSLDIHLFSGIQIHHFQLPQFIEIKKAFNELPIIKLITSLANTTCPSNTHNLLISARTNPHLSFPGSIPTKQFIFALKIYSF